MPFKFIMGDITTYNGDAILNSLGPNGKVYGRICRAIIEKAKSKELKEFIDGIENAQATSIFVTDAGALPSKHIIHVVTPYKKYDLNNTLLVECYRKVLNEAIKRGYKSICLPIIGSGGSGYSTKDGYEALMKACREVDLKEEELDQDIIDITGLTYISNESYVRKLEKEIESELEMEYARNSGESVDDYISRKINKMYESKRLEDRETISDINNKKFEIDEYKDEEEISEEDFHIPHYNYRGERKILYDCCKVFSLVHKNESPKIDYDFFKEHKLDPTYPFSYLEYLMLKKGRDIKELSPTCDRNARKQLSRLSHLHNKDIYMLSTLAELTTTEMLEFMAFNGSSFSPNSWIDTIVVQYLLDQDWPIPYSDFINEFEDITKIELSFAGLSKLDKLLDQMWLTPGEKAILLKEKKNEKTWNWLPIEFTKVHRSSQNNWKFILFVV